MTRDSWRNLCSSSESRSSSGSVPFFCHSFPSSFLSTVSLTLHNYHPPHSIIMLYILRHLSVPYWETLFHLTSRPTTLKLTSSCLSHHVYSHSVGVIYSALTFAGADVLYVCLLNTRVYPPSGLQHVYRRTSTHRIVKCLISP